MKLKQSAWEKAKKITSFFEGWLSGSFDGQFLSYGYLQWNFGQGTLQPLFNRLFTEFPQVAEDNLPDGGMWLQAALQEGRENEWTLEIQDRSYCILDPWLSALQNLYWTPEWQQIMDDAAQWYIDRAIGICEAFGLTTDRAFALAFDIAVQNGGLDYYEMVETEYLDKLISWAEVAALKSNPMWQSDVRARKTAIVYNCNMGRGWPEDVVFDDQSAFEDDAPQEQPDELTAAMEVLNGQIEIEPAYWLENARPGKQCEGEYVAAILIRMAERLS